jgi:hypothetical protein
MDTARDPTIWALDLDRSQVRSRALVGVAASIQRNAAEILRYEAAARDIPMGTLIGKILEMVAKDDLFVAILDQ